MDDLIKALTILNKYLVGNNKEYPTSCEHDVLYVHVDYTKISQEDLDELETLGFRPCEYLGIMMSNVYGSC